MTLMDRNAGDGDLDEYVFICVSFALRFDFSASIFRHTSPFLCPVDNHTVFCPILKHSHRLLHPPAVECKVIETILLSLPRCSDLALV